MPAEVMRRTIMEKWMRKRLMGAGLALMLLPGILAGCSGTEEAGKELTEVTLNEVAHSIFYAPMYVAVEEGYFEEEGIALDLVCGFGADKTMTAVISGEADIGFMGSEASIYTYNEGATDYVVNFAQLTQRAGNFLVAREEMPDFTWEDLKGTQVLGGRKGGMPQMVFEYILRKNGMDPAAGSRRQRVCSGFPWYGQRIRSLHCFFCKAKLYRGKSGDYPGIYGRPAEGHGLCAGSYAGGDRAGD